MSGRIKFTPVALASGTGFSQGIWTLDPTLVATPINASGDVPPSGVAGQNGVGASVGAINGGGVSSIYWGTSQLYVNIGPEIHATSTQTLSQDSFESITMSVQGVIRTFKTRGVDGTATSTYTLNSDKSATWNWGLETNPFLPNIPIEVVLK